MRSGTKVTLVAAVLTGLAAGCGSAGSGQGASSGGSQSERVSASRTVDEHASGTTVRLREGDHLRVVLHSTYWQFPTKMSTAVLVPDGALQVVTAPPGSCPPGTGCGRVVQSFRAAGPGTTTLTASRSSCGEAMRCTGGAGSYTVTVVVTG